MAVDPAPATTGDTSLLEDVTKMIGAAAALLLVLSTAFDFNYLLALGLAFEDVPTTLADHVRSALVWTPVAAAYMLFIGISGMMMSRVDRGLPEEELIRNSRFPKLTRGYRKSARIISYILIALVLVADFLFNSSDRVFYLIALVTWGSLARWVVKHERLGARFKGINKRLFVGLPVLVILVSLLGYGQGHAVLEKTSATWVVTLKSESGTTQHLLLGLRRFTTSAVMVGADRKVSVIPNDLITTATITKRADAPFSRLCTWFGIACSCKL